MHAAAQEQDGGADARADEYVVTAEAGSVPKPLRVSLGRTNDQWIEDLGCLDCRRREAAIADLNAFLRGRLARAFGASVALLDQDLDDFCQEAVVRVLDGLGSFRGDSRFTTWATTIAMRVAHSELRRRRSADVSLEDVERNARQIGWTPRSPVLAADVRIESENLFEALRSAIFEALSERQRTVVLAELQGVSSERMADLMGTNRNNVYKLFFDARRKLRKTLNARGFLDGDVGSILEQLK